MLKQILVNGFFSIWALTTIVAGLAFYHTRVLNEDLHTLNQELRVQISILNQLRVSEAEMCIGTYKVNKVCEETVAKFVEQLGLDVSPSTVLTTAITNRYLGGVGGAPDEP
jgi:hypothetical protein